MAPPLALLAIACLLATTAALPGAAASQQRQHGGLAISSAHRTRTLAQAAPAIASQPSAAAGGAPGGAAAGGAPPGTPSGPPPNATQLAGIIIGSFNASADNTTHASQRICSLSPSFLSIAAVHCKARNRSSNDFDLAGARHAACAAEPLNDWRGGHHPHWLAAHGWQLDVRAFSAPPPAPIDICSCL